MFTPATAQANTVNTTTFTLGDTSSGYVKPSSSGTPTVLGNFDLTNGSQPLGGLIYDPAGDLSGTTVTGGSLGGGTMFELVKTATGYSTPVTISGLTAGLESWNSFSLTFDPAGNLLGVLRSGGPYNDGGVFEVASTDALVRVTNSAKAAPASAAAAHILAAVTPTSASAGMVSGTPAASTPAASTSVFTDWAHLLGATNRQGSVLPVVLSANENSLAGQLASNGFGARNARLV